MGRRTARTSAQADDLFTGAGSPMLRHRLATAEWPDPLRVPVNHAAAHVRQSLWADLESSRDPLLVAGFSSVEEIIALAAKRRTRAAGGVLRILLGTEPFVPDTQLLRAEAADFDEQVRAYWIEQRGVSLLLSGRIVEAIEALDAAEVEVRFVPGRNRLHAKVYIGDNAATVGSSNFTRNGLDQQIEANVRFELRDEPRRFEEVRQLAENYWDVGENWAAQLRALLDDLLRFVSWQEALARACSELIDGDWASSYVAPTPGAAPLWPSQVAGIAQAMWIVEAVGSVLVADATGAGKTRMGAALTRAVKDRLWSTGRVRNDLTVLVGPPPVQQQWIAEAIACGLTLFPVSHGLLSRDVKDGTRSQAEAVNKAQILAIDEAHNFLSAGSNRTQHVRASRADHVLMFTATPINRGTEDLLSLIDLLGADNFDDTTLAVLDRLARHRTDQGLSDAERDHLRREIQRFTVRRTKAAINEMVDRDPAAFTIPATGRVCRYPSHVMRTYRTGETPQDVNAAGDVRAAAAQLRGLTHLGRHIKVPDHERHRYTDQRWLDMRLGASAGLAAHLVLAGMRSSTAALVEHVAGTDAATRELGITGLVKPQRTGDMIGTLKRLAAEGPPRTTLDCQLPPWLADAGEWRTACEREASAYRSIHAAAHRFTGAREAAKAAVVRDLLTQHERVIAFDRHPITLAAIAPLVAASGTPVITATSGDPRGRKAVAQLLRRESDARGAALCSDALSEGLNLQGASAIVHFDLPTTLRSAEQRVGRVDRMDSPHDAIEAWWPDDGEAFATTANDLLADRNSESTSLLGSNLPLPHLAAQDTRRLSVTELAQALEEPREDGWDGIRDALEPVRHLVHGPDRLIGAAEYEAHRGSTTRVVSRISPVDSAQPWAFLSFRGPARGAPRWLLLEGDTLEAVTGLDRISDSLRRLLANDPPSRTFDAHSDALLARVVAAATECERNLIPRRLRRALDQMAAACARWATLSLRHDDYVSCERWRRLAALTEPGDGSADPVVVAERWLELVRPLLEQARRSRSRQRYTLLAHIEPDLAAPPFPVDQLESHFSGLPVNEPIENRVTACILGVPHTV